MHTLNHDMYTLAACLRMYTYMHTLYALLTAVLFLLVGIVRFIDFPNEEQMLSSLYSFLVIR